MGGCGRIETAFFHSWRERDANLPICCGKPMYPILSVSNPSLFFEEGGGGRVIHNLGPEPVRVTSRKQHQELMKQAGVTWASKDDMLHQKTRKALDARH